MMTGETVSIELGKALPIDTPATPRLSGVKGYKITNRVLVVEDNAVNQAVITGDLQAFDLVVSVANNGVEALE